MDEIVETLSQLKKVAPKVASVEEIRSYFPALTRVQGGQPVAYFDGPGGTQVPRGVAEAITDYLYYHNANAHWAFPTSAETDEIIAYSRHACADFLNASADEIVFGANMTTLAFHLARAVGRMLEPDDEIIVTELDHHANIAPWQQLENERGLKIKTARMLPDMGVLDWEHLESLLNSRTKLLAIGAASNAVGTINDIGRAVSAAHAVGALVFVDAVHLASHARIDVRKLDCDFLSCSVYKFYGPHVGILYGKRDLLQMLDFPKLLPAPDSAPERAETGTKNHEGIAGTAAAIDFLASLAKGEGTRPAKLNAVFDELHRRGSRLLTRMWEGLSAVENVRLYGPPPDAPRTPTIALTIEGLESAEIARRLATRGIFASHGDFYAKTLVERLDAPNRSLVRAGCACYTSTEEVERLLAEVASIAAER